VTARIRISGLLVAAVALAGQIALGAVILRAPSAQAEAASLASVSFFCHAGGASTKLPHHPPTWHISALAQAVAGAASLLGPASPCIPAPVAPALSIPRPQAPRAPPSVVRLAHEPRGPPVLT
jgi:hypothetical protein